MDDRKQEKYIADITEIIHAVVRPTVEAKRRIINSSYKKVSYSLIDEWVDRYKLLLKSLSAREGWSRKYSEKYLDGQLKIVIGEALNGGDDGTVALGFRSMVENFDSYALSHDVYIPLYWINVSVGTLELGNVVLREMTPELAAQIATRLEGITDAGSSPEDVKALTKGRFRERLQALKGCTLSHFSVIAEPTRARERAEEETRRVIELLRYAIPAIYPSNLRVTVELLGEGPYRQARTSPVIAADNSLYNWEETATGPLVPFEINEESIARLNEVGVMAVSQILQKDSSELTGFEDSILRGVHWLANSLTQIENENACLSLITSIESYLTPKDGNPIGTAVAEAVAIILAGDLPTRRQLKRRIKEFYGKRSAVTHGGRKDLLDSDVLELRGLAGALTMWMIGKRAVFATTTALLEWVEEQKLT